MGNRAVITTNSNLDETGIYLHWNGGRSSVEAFLAYCNLKGHRCPEDDCYGWSYLVATIANTFGNGVYVGIDNCEHLDTNNYDNGVYVIKNWLITERIYADSNYEQADYDLLNAVKTIDDRQPEHMRITQTEWNRFDEVKQATLNARLNCIYKDND